MSRHGRQTRLAEVGVEGQARIAGATLTVASRGLAAEVATRYLAGAGVGCLRVDDARLEEIAAAVDPSVSVEMADGVLPAAPASDLAGLVDPGARAVAEGAREALRSLRAVLGVTAAARAPGMLHTLHRARQPS
ncbi:MAG TPA: hypothetical protein VHV30_02535 [Polyangiaceae bacterium]|jgi:hypothetical protein|nr:hypothetical protein [Polyangiaceae bacterium]